MLGLNVWMLAALAVADKRAQLHRISWYASLALIEARLPHTALSVSPGRKVLSRNACDLESRVA